MAASRSSKTWRWDGSRRIANRHAQVLGETLEAIRKRKKGKAAASDVVNAARPKRSPLHSLFEWNNTKAAELYRQEQARGYIRSLVVEITTPQGRTAEIPAAVSFVGERGYYGGENVLTDSRLRDRLLTQALKEAESWMERYQHLQELSEAFVTLRKVRSRIMRKTVQGGARKGAAVHGVA